MKRDIMALPMMLCASSRLPANLKQGAVSNHLGRSRDLVSIRDEPGRDCLALLHGRAPTNSPSVPRPKPGLAGRTLTAPSLFAELVLGRVSHSDLVIIADIAPTSGEELGCDGGAKENHAQYAEHGGP